MNGMAFHWEALSRFLQTQKQLRRERLQRKTVPLLWAM